MAIMEPLAALAYLFIGALSGFLAGLLGIGGGVIAVPCLFFFFSATNLFDPTSVVHIAIGTSLASTALATLVSAWFHNKREALVWPLALSMLPGLLIGSLLGALIARFLSGSFLERLFGLFIFLVGIHFLVPFFSKRPDGFRPTKFLLNSLSLIIALVASLLGIGGGVFMVPFLDHIGITQKKAIGTAAGTSVVIAFLGALGYLYFGIGQVTSVKAMAGYIYLPAFITVGLAALFLAPIGVKCAHILNEKWLRRIFGVALVLVALLMIF